MKTSVTIGTAVYTSFSTAENRNLLVSATSSEAARDHLTLTRTLPKQSGNFRGARKVSIKRTHDVVVTGVDGSPMTLPLISEVSFSIPVGVASGDLDALRTEMGLVVSDSELDDVIERGFV